MVVVGCTVAIVVFKVLKKSIGHLFRIKGDRKRSLNVLVTGASQGMGKGFAYVFAKNGHNVILVARNEQKLQSCVEELREKYANDKNKSRVIDYISCDLSEPDAPEKLMEKLKEMDFNVEVLVNNAASLTCIGTLFQENTMEQIEQTIKVNILAPTKLTRLALDQMMKNNKFGKILNVSTVISGIPLPYGSVYFASKTYLASFTDSLRNDLKIAGNQYRNIHIMTFLPGVTKTRNPKGEEMPIDCKSDLSGQSPLDCATKGYNDLMIRGEEESVASWMVGIMRYGLMKVLPTSMIVKMVTKELEKFAKMKRGNNETKSK